MNDELIQQLKAEHGEIYLLTAAEQSVIVKKPSRAVVKRFLSTITKDDRRHDAFEALLKDCVVWPDRAELGKLLEHKPGIVLPFGQKLSELAGAVEEADFRPL
jgi:hypothetical protein